MKKLLIIPLLLSGLFFTGCSSKTSIQSTQQTTIQIKQQNRYGFQQQTSNTKVNTRTRAS